MTPPVSVIVPARNEAQTIARVVSVLADMPDVCDSGLGARGRCCGHLRGSDRHGPCSARRHRRRAP